MIKSDIDNLRLTESIAAVDKINAQFYGRFPYPWAPVNFSHPDDPYLHTDLINQDIGDWGRSVIPKNPNIWVAGCGTNQAVCTALSFPKGTVLGSDLSSTSLEICARNAKSLGVSNLQTKRESLNTISYKDQFDYLICTGVIHHNADPRATLEKLAGALKPEGIMELMVYNRFHWILPVAFQQAVRILGGNTDTINFESELSIAKTIMGDLPQETLLARFTNRFKESPESRLADELLQPVLHSYTVESLEQMAESCGLELISPCLNQFDIAARGPSWNMEFSDPILKEIYESLPDTQRWQVTNLLLIESSPMIWFYLQRKDSGRQRKSERQTCEEFLDTRFARIKATQSVYLLTSDGQYKLLPDQVAYPSAAPDSSVKGIVDLADGKASMREIFQRLGLSTSFYTVNQARLKTTSTAYPYLKAVRADELEGDRQISLASTADEKEKRAKANLEKLKTARRTGLRTSQ